MGKEKKPKKKLKKSAKIFLTVMEVVCICIAAFAGWKIWSTFHGYKKNNETYEDLSDEVVNTPEPTASASADTGLHIDWASLQAVNSDTAAWIYQKGTPINYPVVYGTDNSYYLNHDINGNISNLGTAFVDAGNQKDFADRNTTIYAHNVLYTNLMFSTLDNYRNQSYYDEHPELDLYTPDTHYKLYPVAGKATTGSDPYVQLTFADEAEYQSYVQSFVDVSTFQSKETVGEGDKTVLLSTCSFKQNNGRYALLCKLVEADD